jgi:hypothetical protein
VVLSPYNIITPQPRHTYRTDLAPVVLRPPEVA